ncbi:MAG TPA: hypothetical protein VER58_13070 [Thermoanaerobaculia bacterium]|nr:hypothetical protein [Thermoanaerobaculia bacterium]
MRNAHSRELVAPIERVRPWIEASWTGTARDPFPRDVLPSWRQNPPGIAPLALVPNVTRVGHGSFSFRFESWDGERWRARVESRRFPGWHGFDLAVTSGGCRVTHTVELEDSILGRVLWSVFIAPIHDWCVEALLDRIEEALRTGEMPATTRRKMPWHAATSFALLRRAGRGRRKREHNPS